MGRFLINFQVNGFSSSKWSNGVSGCRPKMQFTEAYQNNFSIKCWTIYYSKGQGL